MSRKSSSANELMQFTEMEADTTTAIVTVEGGLLFDYSQIGDRATRSFAEQKTVELKRLLGRNRDMQTKLYTLRVQIGMEFIAMKERALAEESLWLDWLKTEFNCTRPADIRATQQLMAIARDVQAKPELADLAHLEIRDYLAAELLAPSTPEAARVEVLDAIIEAKAGGTSIADQTRLVRSAIAKHKPTKAKATINSGGGGGSGVHGVVIPPPALPPARKQEIMSIRRASDPAPLPVPEPAVVTFTGRFESNTLYALGEHYAWTGSTADPRLLQMLPHGQRLEGAEVLLQVLGIVAAPANNARTVALFENNGTLWLVSPDLHLISQLFDAWSERTGIKPSRLELLSDRPSRRR